MWIVAAIFSAFFAGVTSILAKLGIKNTDSDVATFIRTFVVLIFSFIMVLVVGSLPRISSITLKSLIFLILSGLATGASWICYFKALSMANVNKVVPIDKSSTVLSIILAIILFNETNNIIVKTIGVILISFGIFLMIEKKEDNKESKKGWLIFGVLSAVFASLTSILAKVGIEGIESNLATFIRTIVVLIMSFIIVLFKKKTPLIKGITKKELIFIILSGIATGASWLMYYYAIQKGVVSVVVPIDKLSIIFTVIFSYLFLKEKLSKKAFIGLILMVVGTLLMVIFS